MTNAGIQRLYAAVERARLEFEIATLLCRGETAQFDAQWPEHAVPPDKWVRLRFAQPTPNGLLLEEVGVWYWQGMVN